MTDSTIEVQGRHLKLSNLEKVLYPAVGFTKQQVIDYYVRIAEVMLTHIRERPLTMKRFPDGVEGKSFFEKHIPSHAPDWVHSVNVPSNEGRDVIPYAMVNDLPTLAWAAKKVPTSSGCCGPLACRKMRFASTAAKRRPLLNLIAAVVTARFFFPGTAGNTNSLRT